MIRALYDCPAPAKINLFLHVIGRRDDGYHLLQSIFQLVDWHDTLHFERRDDGRLARRDLGPALPEDDLCLRAARALQRESGTAMGADISIAKQVPWGAGLGGGSSDAATTLLALNRLWRLDWPRPRLLALGLALGADVPFFLGGDNAWVEGIGERLTPLRLPAQQFAIVKPPAAIATRDIFCSPLLTRDTAPAILSGSLADDPQGPETQVGRFAQGLIQGLTQGSAQGLAQGGGRNDLQPAAEAACPEVAQAAGWLAARYGNSRMTGSGSAVFSRAGAVGQPTATFPAEALPPGWVGRMCRGLERHPLRDWASG